MPQTACPHCNKEFRVKAEYVSRQVKCPNCKTPFVIETLTGSDPSVRSDQPGHSPSQPIPSTPTAQPDPTSASGRSSKPVGRWVVIGIFGFVFLGAVVWGVVALLGPDDQDTKPKVASNDSRSGDRDDLSSRSNTPDTEKTSSLGDPKTPSLPQVIDKSNDSSDQPATPTPTLDGNSDKSGQDSPTPTPTDESSTSQEKDSTNTGQSPPEDKPVATPPEAIHEPELVRILKHANSLERKRYFESLSEESIEQWLDRMPEFQKLSCTGPDLELRRRIAKVYWANLYDKVNTQGAVPDLPKDFYTRVLGFGLDGRVSDADVRSSFYGFLIALWEHVPRVNEAEAVFHTIIGQIDKEISLARANQFLRVLMPHATQSTAEYLADLVATNASPVVREVALGYLIQLLKKQEAWPVMTRLTKRPQKHTVSLIYRLLVDVPSLTQPDVAVLLAHEDVEVRTAALRYIFRKAGIDGEVHEGIAEQLRLAAADSDFVISRVGARLLAKAEGKPNVVLPDWPVGAGQVGISDLLKGVSHDDWMRILTSPDQSTASRRLAFGGITVSPPGAPRTSTSRLNLPLSRVGGYANTVMGILEDEREPLAVRIAAAKEWRNLYGHRSVASLTPRLRVVWESEGNSAIAIALTRALLSRPLDPKTALIYKRRKPRGAGFTTDNDAIAALRNPKIHPIEFEMAIRQLQLFRQMPVLKAIGEPPAEFNGPFVEPARGVPSNFPGFLDIMGRLIVHPDRKTRQMVANALASCGPEAKSVVPALIKAIDTYWYDPDLRYVLFCIDPDNADTRKQWECLAHQTHGSSQTGRNLSLTVKMTLARKGSIPHLMRVIEETWNAYDPHRKNIVDVRLSSMPYPLPQLATASWDAKSIKRIDRLPDIVTTALVRADHGERMRTLRFIAWLGPIAWSAVPQVQTSRDAMDKRLNQYAVEVLAAVIPSD